MEIGFRPFAARDDEAVRALHARSFAALAQDSHTHAQIDAHVAYMHLDAYEDELQNAHLHLAVDAQGILLGTAGWQVADDDEPAARIRKVFVDPAHARRGIGAKLVLEMERQARLAGFTRLTVRSNINAVPLYERLGYRETSRGSMEVAGGIGLPVVFMAK